MPLITIKSEQEYKQLIESAKVTVILFTADWVEQCKQVQDVMEDVNKIWSDKMQFAKITAEEFPNISFKHQIDAVPTVIFLSKGEVIDRIDGVDVAKMIAKCRQFSEDVDALDESLKKRLKALINTAPLMVFIKGKREAPRCGFSKQVITILNETGIPYETFDILTDEDVRQGLKKYSDWPTYPQVYVKGQLIGGIDIINELVENCELDAVLRGE